MVVLAKKAGVVGLPAGVKEQGRRVDFRKDEFTLALETKGYRLSWSRAAYCPCSPANSQTEQPDPTCSICVGSGWFMFKPQDAVINPDISGPLDGVQSGLVGSDSVVIQGIMSGFKGANQPYDNVLRHLEGMTMLTVRPENRLGYYDRIVNLDTTIVYSQNADTDGSSSLKTRYPVVCMNLIRSEAQVFVEGTDFELVDGNISWLIAPLSDIRLTLHYLTYPTWRVIEYPHLTRSTLVKFKTKTPATPLGDPTDLPIQAVLKYEFL